MNTRNRRLWLFGAAMLGVLLLKAVMVATVEIRPESITTLDTAEKDLS